MGDYCVGALLPDIRYAPKPTAGILVVLFKEKSANWSVPQSRHRHEVGSKAIIANIPFKCFMLELCACKGVIAVELAVRAGELRYTCT